MGYQGGGTGNQQFARLGRKIAALLTALVSHTPHVNFLLCTVQQCAAARMTAANQNGELELVVTVKACSWMSHKCTLCSLVKRASKLVQSHAQ